MKICFEKIAEPEKYLPALPQMRQIQLLSMKQKKAMLQSLAGEWLVRKMLAEVSEQKPEEIVIVRDGQKKPYLAELPFYFNISHSGDYVMAAVSKNPIGVDLEAVGKDISRVMQRVCVAEDLAYIEANMAAERMMEIWTRKEALVKCLGTGIMDKRMQTVVGIGETKLWMDGGLYYLKSLFVPDGYCCAVCEKII